MIDLRLDVERQFAALPSLRWNEFKRFLDAGAPASGLVWPELPARALVVFLDDRPLFEFAEHDGDDGAVPCFVFVARDQHGEPHDLVGWSPAEGHIAAWYGASCILGGENLLAPRVVNDGALAVFESPLEWLRAKRKGVVVINETRAAIALENAGPLAARDAAHARRLRASLSRPAPRVVVAAAPSQVAA